MNHLQPASAWYRDNFGRLFNTVTGLMVGYVDYFGNEQLVDFGNLAAMPSAANLLTTAALAPYAKTADLAGYAKATDLAGLATAASVTAVANSVAALSVPTGTLAQRDASGLVSTPRARYTTTDTAWVNGATNPMGTEWVSDGTQWRPRMPQTILLDTVVVTGAQQSAEQVLKSYTLPAGLLHLQRFLVEVAVGKTGLTDVLQQFIARLGLAGTTADTQLAATATALLSAGTRSAGFAVQFEATDATTVVRRGTNGGMNLGSFDGASSATAMDTLVTVSNLQTNALKLSLTSSMVTALADRPQVGDIRITLLP